MIIDLQRAFDPEEFGHEEACGICRLPFRTESVLAQAVTDGRIEMGHACPACIEYLGTQSPGLFPTLEDYRDALRRYPEPMQTAAEAEAEDDFDDAMYQASWVWRVPA